MGRVVDHIDEATQRWIEDQHVFFVATAPGSGGHVNVSPKGLDSFRTIGPDQVAYLDLTGSGAETIAHLRDNGRITIMFSAFTGPPRILRIYGTGRVAEPGSEEFATLIERFPGFRGVRSIITVDVDRVQDSCGYAVPEMEYVRDRTRLDQWAGNRTEDELEAYRREKNALSIDGLPALDA